MFSLTHARSLAAAITLIVPGALAAETIQITFTNEQAAGGLYLTPLFTAFHDGGFDYFDAGSSASAATQALAEGGDASGLVAEAGSAATGVITSPGGFPGAPVFDPGETASITLELDPNSDRFFSFASMLIPTNDLFLGNDDATAFEIFDAAGVFTGDLTISLFGSNVWDAGTELNNNLDAAFNVNNPTPRTDENGVISGLSSLDYLLGQTTAAGTTISSVPGAGDLLASIQISRVAPVPVPASLPILGSGLGLMAFFGRRSRRKA